MSALRIAMDAYAALLRIPASPDRMQAQHIMAELRDFIALKSGESSEDVQEKFSAVERIARRQP